MIVMRSHRECQILDIGEKQLELAGFEDTFSNENVT